MILQKPKCYTLTRHALCLLPDYHHVSKWGRHSCLPRTSQTLCAQKKPKGFTFGPLSAVGYCHGQPSCNHKQELRHRKCYTLVQEHSNEYELDGSNVCVARQEREPMPSVLRIFELQRVNELGIHNSQLYKRAYNE